MWDLRRNYTSYKKEPLPKHSIPYPGSSTYQGYSNLLIDSIGQRLYVNCMDHNIYCFNLGVYATQPIMSYTGLTNSTFYIKSSLSPDDKFLISGSKDEKAYIWNVEYPTPILALAGHADEVTCVAWSKSTDLRIVTCSDDSRHKIWRINYDNTDEDTSENYLGKAEVIKMHKPNNKVHHRRRFNDLENTPRSLKRIVEVNETTPSSTEKVSLKRSFADMATGDSQSAQNQGGDSKRQLIETRARRLFSPSTSSTSSFNAVELNRMLPLPTIDETPPREESEKLVSPLNERNHLRLNHRFDDISTPSSSLNRPSCSQTLFSPTSNLPNYVIDGDAPHLKLQSPKRKLKENIDWLTKIRKQKLSTTINRQLNKMHEFASHDGYNQSHTVQNAITSQSELHQQQIDQTAAGILSPRMRKLKSTERTQRRSSICHQPNESAQPASPMTPTRRKSETTLLRYFCVTPTTRSREQSPAPSNHQ